MNLIRKNIINITPHIAWTLVLGVFYAYIAGEFNKWFLEDVSKSVETLYLKGLLLFIPIFALGYFYTKLNTFGKFLLAGIIIILCSLVISQCIIFTIIVILPYYRRICNHLYGETGDFDRITTSAIISMGIFYIYSAFTEQVFLQEIIIQNTLIVMILMFVRNGLIKSEEYVMLRQEKSNMPSQLILDKSTKIFIITGLLVILIISPIINSQYQFLSFAFDPFDFEAEEVPLYEAEEEVLEENFEKGPSYEELDEMGRASYTEYLYKLYDFIEPIIYIATLIFLINVFVKGILAFIEILHNPIVVKNDIIESTLNTDEKDVKTSLGNSFNLGEIFNFSSEMTVRRKYKRTLKKHSPKNWQTPTEMETMAKIDIPKLHNEYLEARYGKNSSDI